MVVSGAKWLSDSAMTGPPSPGWGRWFAEEGRFSHPEAQGLIVDEPEGPEAEVRVSRNRPQQGTGVQVAALGRQGRVEYPFAAAEDVDVRRDTVFGFSDPKSVRPLQGLKRRNVEQFLLLMTNR